MSLALATGWSALVLAAAWSARPAPPRWTTARAPRRRPRGDTARDRLAVALCVTVAAAVVVPLAGPVAGAVAWFLLARRPARRARRQAADVVDSLPEAVDLLRLAVSAGLTVPPALALVARRGHGTVARSLRSVVDAAARGSRWADALETLPMLLGEPVRPLVAAVVTSERYGAPLDESLDRLAAEVRADRRRRAEESARRVPVKLLFPLVVCVLPAFALLTVVPLLAGGLASL